MEHSGLWAGSPRTICAEILEDMHGRMPLADLQQLSSDHDAAVDKLIDLLPMISSNQIVGDRPAEAVLRERIAQIQTPELVAIVGQLKGASEEAVVAAWLSAVGGRTIERKPLRVDEAPHATPCAVQA